MTEVRASSRAPKRMVVTGSTMVVMAIIVAFAASFLGGANEQIVAAATNAPAEPTASVETSILPQCRVDAVTAFMAEAGFTDGDYLIGEERLDTSLPEFSNAGSLAFGSVTSRDELGEMFTSQNSAAVALTSAQLLKFEEEYGSDVVLNSENWEIVQMNVPMAIAGNTGFSDGTVIDAGTRESDVGDAFWVFIDPESCSVPRALVTASGATVDPSTPESERPIGFIRVGCANPGDGPKPPPPPPMCEWKPWLPPDHPECLAPKDPTLDPIPPDGVDRIDDPGPETGGDESEDQHEDGDVDGNVIDDPVDSDTGSGDTTPETDIDTPGGNSGGDNRDDDVVDPDVIIQDDGGTDGGTEISEPTD